MSAPRAAVDPVTARWAGALFQLARRSGALDDVARDVERLGAELANPAVRAFLLGSRTAKAARLAKLDGLLAGFHPLTRNFVRLAFDRRREPVLVGVAEAFRRRALEESGVLEGVAEAPRALGSSELERLETSLSARLGRRVTLTSAVNEGLVAGVRVRVGTRMIDQSVQGRLVALRRRLEEARLPAGA